MKIPELKYYNLCIPREILDTAKSNAAKQGVTLKEYLAKAVIEANNKVKTKGEIHGAGRDSDSH